MKRFLFSIFILFSLVFVTKGQDVSVKASFDTTRIFIGDQIKFTITVDKPSDLRLSLPFYKDTLCKNIEILSGPVVDSTKKDGRTTIIERYHITSFDSGSYQLSPVIAESYVNNELKRFYSDFSKLEVIRVNITPADTTMKIYDIVNPYKAPVTLDEILPWVFIIALLCAIAWFVVRYVKNHKRVKTDEQPVTNPDPAHVIAFHELEKLKADELWQKGEVKHYYTRLTEILRQYLENRFGVYSLELTTEETLKSLLKTGFKKDESYNQLKTILTGADLVKFAKHKPDASENEMHFQNSWNFVDSTKVIEVMESTVDNKDKEKEGAL
ncbi:MAG TPA: hypothetical protein PLR88_11100 [Bacteroidales bacterium]|nr:hypothetical protein [Bacteroidales bacterium]